MQQFECSSHKTFLKYKFQIIFKAVAINITIAESENIPNGILPLLIVIIANEQADISPPKTNKINITVLIKFTPYPICQIKS